jgi:cytoskeletal protein RodZ
MKEIGEYLKNRRIELGISLDEAEQYLKIRKKYLVGIEEGNESILPGRTYFIGYLRNYANYLEADQEYISQLLGETKQAPKTIEQEQEPEPEQEQETVEPVSKRKRTGKYFSPEKSKYRPKREKRNISYIPFIKIIAIIILLGGGIFIVNQFLNRTEQPSRPVNNDEENIVETTEDEQKTIEQELTEMAEEELQKEEIEESLPGVLLEPLPDYKPIRVVVQEPAWVKIMDNNDQVLFESLIISSEEITIKSEGPVSLLTSSADDIRVFYDDEEIEARPTDNYRLMYYQIVASNENN